MRNGLKMRPQDLSFRNLQIFWAIMGFAKVEDTENEKQRNSL